MKVDSAEIVHGAFFMSGEVDTVKMAALYMGSEEVMPLVIEKGNVKVTITDNLLQAKGTPLNDALYDFIQQRNEIEAKLDELERKEMRMMMEGEDLIDIHRQLNKESEALVMEMNQYIKQFISNNYENVLGPNVFMMLCSSLPYPILTPQVEAIINDAPYNFKMNYMVKNFISKAKENMQLIEEYERLQQKEIVADN